MFSGGYYQLQLSTTNSHNTPKHTYDKKPVPKPVLSRILTIRSTERSAMGNIDSAAHTCERLSYWLSKYCNFLTNINNNGIGYDTNIKKNYSQGFSTKINSRSFFFWGGGSIGTVS